ncbi:hypothetical protein H4W31_001248 [Plantactinospora soyae]|uniref:Mutator family transposase n=1 Tax=Plantactinospora soyae TaxID=1544732 RepID=A0A927QVD7_9ACTN|nr:hypothetical protein [Plantactinospora soyae]
MVKTFAQALMSAEADAICGAPYGQRSEERVNSRNGYRAREWDTRAGTIDLAVPKLRTGSYFPDWLLTHRRRAEQALVSVVATSYLLGVSTRRVEKLVEQLGIRQLPKSQVSEMAAHLDAQVEAFRNRPLDTGPYTFVWMDALTTGQRSSTSSTGRHDRWESHPDEQWHADGRVRRSPAARDHHRGPGSRSDRVRHQPRIQRGHHVRVLQIHDGRYRWVRDQPQRPGRRGVHRLVRRTRRRVRDVVS